MTDLNSQFYYHTTQAHQNQNKKEERRKMDSQAHAIHSWTFAGLVGAFLDLALAYLLLCGSTLTFFASKLLSFLGLYLPCPCNHGLFNDPYGNKCFKRLLVDFPTAKISSVHVSVKSKFPFDSIWMNNNDHQSSGRRHQLNLKLVRDNNNNNDCCDGGGLLEMEGEASCSSFSDARAPIRKKKMMSDVVALGLLSSSSVLRAQTISSDVDVDVDVDVVGGKGKTISNHHHRSSSSSGIRRRRPPRRRASVDHGKSSSVSSSDPSGLLMRRKVSVVSPYSISQTGHEITEDEEEGEETSMLMISKMNNFQYVEEAPVGFNYPQGSRTGFQMTESRGEGGGDNMEKDAPSVGESVDSSHIELGLNANETHSIRMLEQALEEEHAARNALYLELEKERSAAASAADEAMAMILRLQEEKASIEMEARQYQRMIEEKSAYDAEEMNILKEILLRREMEKHFLEKEVEAIRNSTCLGDQQLEGDSPYVVGMSRQRSNLIDSSEDPVFMLQEISESINKKEMMENMKNNFDYDTFSLNEQSCSLAFGEMSPSPDWNADDDFLKRKDKQKSLNSERHLSHVPVHMDDCRHKLGEKEGVFMDEHPSSSQHQGETLNADSGLLKSNESQGHQLHEKTIIFLDGQHEQKENSTLCQGAPKTDQTLSDVEISFPCDSTDLDKHGKNVNQGGRDPKTSSFETEPSVYDVHVIDDESMRCNHKIGKESELVSVAAISGKSNFLPLEVSGSRRNHILSDSPSTSRLETEFDIHRSSSDMSTVSGMMDKSLGKAVNFGLQKNPISAVDNERSKLETEVDWLRERLRIVQEGREKLSFSVEHREREQIQLQLLEDIASQLREIRQLTEPGKAVRQASLPPSSSKVSLKKRRCRSVSWGIPGSN